MLRLYVGILTLSAKTLSANFLSRILRILASLFAQTFLFWGMSSGVMRTRARAAIG
jgi:hypothetical protein